MVDGIADEARFRTPRVLNTNVGNAKSFVTEVLAHQQSPDLAPAGTPKLTLKTFQDWVRQEKLHLRGL
jgi:hypothetical protein